MLDIKDDIHLKIEIVATSESQLKYILEDVFKAHLKRSERFANTECSAYYTQRGHFKLVKKGNKESRIKQLLFKDFGTQYKIRIAHVNTRGLLGHIEKRR